MNYKIGQYVVYGSSGICILSGIENKCFDGVNTNEYCKLTPLNSEKSTYYIPIATINEKVRDLLSKKEVEDYIDRMPTVDMLSISDNHQKKDIYNSILKSGDYIQLISMMKYLYAQQQDRISKGKRLTSFDEKAMRDAENTMYEEFATVLNIDLEEVKIFIRNRIENKL